MTQLDEPPEDPYADDTHAGDRSVTPIRPGEQHNLPAERAILGALLVAPELADALLAELDPDDFYSPQHETIWRVWHEAHERDGHPPDVITILTAIRESGARIAPDVLPSLVTDLPRRDVVIRYATEVRNAARERRIEHQLRLALGSFTDRTRTPLDQRISDLVQVVEHEAVRFTSTHASVSDGGLRDLSWLLSGNTPTVAPPAWVHRSDGRALFYSGRVNGVYGDPEAAKTWLAHLGIIQALDTGRRAALIDVDHNGPIMTTERLILLGADPTVLADPDRFRYLEPEDAGELRAAIAALVTWAPAYVVLDSIGEMMPMLGIKSVDNDELSGALRTIATALAQTGACVVTIDHLPKSQESRSSGFAIGGTAKKRAIDGSYIHAESKMPPAPGALGKIVLRIEKDRPGRLREVCTGKYVGTFVLDSTQHGHTTASIENESGVTETGTFRPTGVMEQISRFVEEHDQASFTDIKATVSAKDATLRAAIGLLVEEGFMSTHDGGRRRVNHHTIALFREDDDDQN